MSKKNSREQRKKQAQRAAASAEQEKNLAKKDPNYVKPEKKEKKGKEPAEPQIKMNFYSAMAMLSTLVSAGVFVVAMIVTGNAKEYSVACRAGEAYDASVIVEYLDELEDVDFWGSFSPCIKIGLAVVVLCVLFSLLETIASMNPDKKPNMFFAVLMVACSVAGLSLYIAANYQIRNMADYLPRLELVKTFGVYNLYLYVLIANVAAQLLNVLGVRYGVNKYKQTGHSC